jgi:hypothetical protein
MTLAQMIARLTRGYVKATGKQPVGLDKLKIKMEAAEKLRQADKIIQFPQPRSFKEEIDAMVKSGDINVGTAPKTPPYQKSQADIDFEIMERIKSDNEKAIKAFEDRNPIKPIEDKAGGGVAGLLGERPGYQDGNIIQTMYPRGNFLNIRANAPTRKDYNIQATKDLVENLPGGVVRDVLAPAAAATLSVPYDAIQAYNRMEPGSGLAGFKDAFMSENPFSSLKERTIGAAGPLADRFNKEKDNEYDFSDIEGQTAFVGLPEIFTLGKTLVGPLIKGGSASAVLKNAAKEKLKREISKKIYRDLQKKITKPKYGTTSPTTKTTTKPTTKKTSTTTTTGGGGGRSYSQPSTAQNRARTASRVSSSGKMRAYGLADGGPARQNFAMGRRAFLKLMGGLGAGIGALKTGLLGLGGKQATKEVAKELITTPAASGKPAWFDALVTRVIREGDDVTKTMATKDRQNVFRKKIDDETEVMVTQDLDEGVTRIDIEDSVRNVTGFDDPPTVSLQVTDEIVEEGGVRTKPQFKATENDYRNYATDPDGGYETEFVENTVENTKDLTSDLTKVKSFATKKGPTMKEIVGSKKRKDNVKYAQENPSSYAADRGPDYDPSDYIEDMADDFASGGIARMLGE